MEKAMTIPLQQDYSVVASSVLMKYIGFLPLKTNVSCSFSDFQVNSVGLLDMGTAAGNASWRKRCCCKYPSLQDSDFTCTHYKWLYGVMLHWLESRLCAKHSYSSSVYKFYKRRLYYQLPHECMCVCVCVSMSRMAVHVVAWLLMCSLYTLLLYSSQ